MVRRNIASEPRTRYLPISDHGEDDAAAEKSVETDAAWGAVDGVLAMRGDGSPRVPSFLLPMMEDVVATGNHCRLVQSIEGTAASGEKSVCEDFRLALLHFVSAPQSASPDTAADTAAECASLSASFALPNPPAPATLTGNEWLEAEAQPSSSLLVKAVAAHRSSSTSSYELLDLPSFHGLAAIVIPPFVSLQEPRLFPAAINSSPMRAPPSLTSLSSPYVDPFIQQLQALAESISAVPSAAVPPPLFNDKGFVTDGSLSSLVEAALDSGSFRPPPAVPLLTSALLQPLSTRYHSSCKRLHSVLLNQCQLMRCLSSLRNFFLAAHGVLIDDFVGLFRSAALSTPLINERLNEALAAAGQSALVGRLRAAHGERASFSSISSSFSSSSVSLLLSLSFHYDAPWPLNEIVTADHVRKYNQVLHLILHLRVSLHALSRLSNLSSRQSALSAHPLAHQFNLFKAAVHHSVRVLHDYVVTHATLSAWTALRAVVESPSASTSLARLRAHHSGYLDRILHLCLLSPNLSAAFAALQKMVGGVGAVEGLGRMIVHEYLTHTIDDWEDDHLRDEEDDDDAGEDDEEERGVKEERRKRARAWRLSLSEAQQRSLQERYEVQRERLLGECWRRLEELRTAHQRNLRFFLLVLEQISSHGVHPHRQLCTPQAQRPHALWFDVVSHPLCFLSLCFLV